MTPTRPTQKMVKRLRYVVMPLLLVAILVVTGNLVNTSVFQHDSYEERANNYQLRREMIPATRGSIYDANMEVLAMSATAWDVTINPSEIQKDEERLLVAKGLSQILGIDETTILEQTKKQSQYELVKRRVEKDVADQIRAFIVEEDEKIKERNKGLEDDEKLKSLTGMINLVENSKRYYPNSTLASSVIGFTGTDSQGLAGLEVKYDEVLSGTPGYTVSLRNALNQTIPNDTVEEKYDPIDGNSLVLTIDETMQYFLEKTLQQVMALNKPAEGCCGIIMDVKTGAILAMDSLPNYDLNNWGEIHDQTLLDKLSGIIDEEEYQAARTEALSLQRYNKCVSQAYEPGSTFKTIVAAAAVEEGTSTLNSSFNCTGEIVVQDQTMHCHVHPNGHGTINFTGAVVNSCNPAFVRIGASLGPDLFFEYFQGFGLTERTGIDLPGEGVSQYYTASQLKSEVSLASCSFGQSLAITPIQLITAVSAVVNGGNLYTPYVVQSVLDANGNVVETTQPTVRRQVISEETSAKMREIMHQVVLQKPGSNAYVEGYDIGGKSGTAQKLDKGADSGIYVSSYVAVAPIDDPQIAVLVMVDEPTAGGFYGSVVASPPVTAILEDVLPYLGISPEYTEEQLAKQSVAVPKLLDMNPLEAASKLAQIGLGKPTVLGDGETVVRQVPSIGSMIPKDGTVILYTEQVEEKTVIVPNVTGLSPAAAKARLEALQLNVDIKGAEIETSGAQITAQDIAEETEVPIGTLITLTSVKAERD